MLFGIETIENTLVFCHEFAMQIAKKLAMSKNKVHRILLEEVGCPPNNFSSPEILASSDFVAAPPTLLGWLRACIIMLSNFSKKNNLF